MKARPRCWRGSRARANGAGSSASISAPTGTSRIASADYVRLIEAFAPVANYFTVNVSSPNTPGLRDLQGASGARRTAGARDRSARARAPTRGPVPVLLKIAPDLSLCELDDVVGVARARKVDGMIVGNTTISRPRACATREGDRAGRPVRPAAVPLSTRMLAETYVRAESAFPLIGVGGVDSGATAIAKIKAGATLIQLYTGWCSRASVSCRRSSRACSPPWPRTGTDALTNMVGGDAADMTADAVAV